MQNGEQRRRQDGLGVRVFQTKRKEKKEEEKRPPASPLQVCLLFGRQASTI
jgi:hypothetical protein